MMKYIFLAFVLSANISFAAGNIDSCLTIKNGIERLSCYDKASGYENAEKTALSNIFFSDKNDAVTVEILDIIVGEDAVRKHKIHAHNFDGAKEQGKVIVYFELRIANNGYEGEINASQNNFKLESTDGEIFSTKQSRDFIRGAVHKGRTTRGGVYFELYSNSFPKRLFYKTGLVNLLGEELIAVSPDIQAYIK